MCEVPRGCLLLPQAGGCLLLPQDGLADAITPDQGLSHRQCGKVNAARFSRSNDGTVGTLGRHRSFNQTKHIGQDYSCSNGACSHMDTLSGYATRPFPFVLRYLRRRLASHVVILGSVVAAVACSVGTQYGVKYLVDGLSAGPARAGSVWLAFVFLMSLIAADNVLWRVASWVANFTTARANTSPRSK